jgi:flagellar basal-body rod protein FlgF
MDNSLIVGLSQQTALQRDLDIIAHNLANMGTNAYKAERPLFQTYLSNVRDVNGQPDEAKLVYDYGMVRDMSEGTLKTTSNPFDLAIDGSGYFVVKTAAGERYTRNGHFSLDDKGQLVTSEGDPVLDSNHNPITFSPEETSLTVARDGSISTSQGQKGKILLVDFANQGELNRTGGSLYKTTEQPTPAKKVDIHQGMLEESNVVPVVEMTTMIDLMRAYTQASQLIKQNEDMSQNTIQTLGKTSA